MKLALTYLIVPKMTRLRTRVSGKMTTLQAGGQ